MAAETEEFLAQMLPEQRAAEQAIHNGDVTPRLALWSGTDPVTLYGANLSGSGWADIGPTFHTVASWFSDSAAYEFEVVAAGASGDLAYTVGYEHNRVKVEGQPRTYTLRHPRLPARARAVADRPPARRRAARPGRPDLTTPPSGNEAILPTLVSPRFAPTRCP